MKQHLNGTIPRPVYDQSGAARGVRCAARAPARRPPVPPGAGPQSPSPQSRAARRAVRSVLPGKSGFTEFSLLPESPICRR